MAKVAFPPPPWVNLDKPWDPDQEVTTAVAAPEPKPDPVPRDPETGRLLPGARLNPTGREKGSKNKRGLMKEELEQYGSDVQRVVISKALAGDMTAASLVLSRLSPPLRARCEKVEFELDPKLSVAEQATQIMVAVSKGEVDPDTGKMLMDCLSAYVGLRDVETFLEDLRRLRDAKTIHPIRGGVLIDKRLHNGSGQQHDHS